MSNAKRQAQRRSSDGSVTSKKQGGLTVNEDGTGCRSIGQDDYEVEIMYPMAEEIVDYMAKPTFGKCAKKKQTLITFIGHRRHWIQLALENCGDEGDRISQLIDDVIPIASPNSKIKAPEVACHLYQIHSALSEFLEYKSCIVTWTYQDPFDELDEAIQYAVSALMQSNMEKQSGCIVKLTEAELRRCYKEDGDVPRDEAFCICLFCKHGFVDEPSTNATAMDRYDDLQREFEKRKKAAAEEEKKTGVKGQRINGPAKPKMYLQCHCFQMFCTSRINVAQGSTCPLGCCDSEGKPFGWDDEKRCCACPICQCPCRAAYGTNAAQILRVRKLLDSGDNKRMEEMNQAKSNQQIAFSQTRE